MNVQDLLNRDYDIMSGQVVFKGTRVPVDTLFTYLAGGSPLKEFLEDFPTVGMAQAKSTLLLAVDLLKEDFL